MKLDNMFKKTRIVSRIQSHNAARASRPEVPEGLLANATSAERRSLQKM